MTIYTQSNVYTNIIDILFFPHGEYIRIIYSDGTHNNIPSKSVMRIIEHNTRIPEK